MQCTYLALQCAKYAINEYVQTLTKTTSHNNFYQIAIIDQSKLLQDSCFTEVGLKTGAKEEIFSIVFKKKQT